MLIAVGHSTMPTSTLEPMALEPDTECGIDPDGYRYEGVAEAEPPVMHESSAHDTEAGDVPSDRLTGLQSVEPLLLGRRASSNLRGPAPKGASQCRPATNPLAKLTSKWLSEWQNRKATSACPGSKNLRQ